MWVLVCYDIANDRARNRAARLLLEYGERVQYSVFRCQLDATRRRQVFERLARIADPETDRVRLERIDSQPLYSLGAQVPEDETTCLF